MSSALAIAAMTYVLKSLLDNRLVQSGVTASVGEVTVTALPPDRVTTGSDERSQINLFLYRVTPHTAWRDDQSSDVRSPALALDLYYLVTAYGARDFEAEILLGYAMQLLFETPVLTRALIRSALALDATGADGDSRPSHHRFASTMLADRAGDITVSPAFLGEEEAAKLWSALQAKYRPSVAYKVSAVTIEVER